MLHLNPGRPLHGERSRGLAHSHSFISLVQSGRYYLFIVSCLMAAHAGGANLIKTTGAKHCWWIEGLLFTLLVGAGGGKNKTKLVNLVNSGKHISLPGPAFNLISMLITKLGLWKCASVCKCETERSRENFSLQSLHPHTHMWSSALATEGKTSVSRVSCLHLIKT